MDASILQFHVLQPVSNGRLGSPYGVTSCTEHSAEGRKTMKQVVNKAVLFSSLHFASAIISITKCCPLGEALDQLGTCQKVLVDRFKEEVNFWTI